MQQNKRKLKNIFFHIKYTISFGGITQHLIIIISSTDEIPGDCFQLLHIFGSDVWLKKSQMEKEISGVGMPMHFHS